MAVGTVECLIREFGDLAGHFDARGSGANDDEGEQPSDLVVICGEFRLVEGADDAAA